jgi:hypothetical protein
MLERFCRLFGPSHWLAVCVRCSSKCDGLPPPSGRGGPNPPTDTASKPRATPPSPGWKRPEGSPAGPVLGPKTAKQDAEAAPWAPVCCPRHAQSACLTPAGHRAIVGLPVPKARPHLAIHQATDHWPAWRTGRGYTEPIPAGSVTKCHEHRPRRPKPGPTPPRKSGSL